MTVHAALCCHGTSVRHEGVSRAVDRDPRAMTLDPMASRVQRVNRTLPGRFSPLLHLDASDMVFANRSCCTSINSSSGRRTNCLAAANVSVTLRLRDMIGLQHSQVRASTAASTCANALCAPVHVTDTGCVAERSITEYVCAKCSTWQVGRPRSSI
jgi:hypothetical protein